MKILLAVFIFILAFDASAVVVKIDGCVVKKVILTKNDKGRVIIKRVRLKNPECGKPKPATEDALQEIEITERDYSAPPLPQEKDDE